MKSIKQELESIYDQYGHQLYVCALAITGHGQLAEDAVHDAFCQAFSKPRSPSNVKAYMFQSVRNAAIDIVRKDRRTRQWTEEAMGQGDDRTTARSGPADDEFQHVLKAMQDLKDNEREIIMSHLVGGMKFREIAELRNQPLGTVTAYYHRGMRRLKGRLENKHE